MKQTRRKELKTNDLSVYLHQMQEWTQQNATYLLVGVAAVVLILVIALVIKRNRYQEMQLAWTEYNDLRQTDPAEKPETLEKIRNLAAQQLDNADLGALAVQLHGDAAYRIALTLTDPKDQARRAELMAEAKKAYQTALDRYGSRQDVRARARLSLGSVEENLVVAGTGSVEAARKYYEQVISDVVDGRPSVYEPLAREKLMDLEERLAKLEIIATRPAETAPATAPALVPATAPAIAPGTAPAAEAAPATSPG